MFETKAKLATLSSWRRTLEKGIGQGVKTAGSKKPKKKPNPRLHARSVERPKKRASGEKGANGKCKKEEGRDAAPKDDCEKKRFWGR